MKSGAVTYWGFLCAYPCSLCSTVIAGNQRHARWTISGFFSTFYQIQASTARLANPSPRAVIDWLSSPGLAGLWKPFPGGGRYHMLAANWSQRWELDVRFRTRWSTLKRAWHGSIHTRGTINRRHPRTTQRNHTCTHPVKESHIQWRDHLYIHSVKGSHAHISSEGIICTHIQWRDHMYT